MRVGDIIPLAVQLPDYANDKFPRAILRDSSGTLIGSPINLALVSNGYYANNSQEFPDDEFISVQYLIYEDSGHTILSPSEGGSVSVIFRDGSPGATEIVPLYAQLGSYDETKYVRAVIRDDTGAQVAGSPVNLTEIADGLYGNVAAIQMPGASAFASIQYLVFDDSSYTILSSTQGGGNAVAFLQPAPSSALPANTGLVGILDSLLQNPINGLQDQLVTGSDRILNARIVRSDNGDPFDLTGATDVAFRFLNADETVTVIKMTDPGAPVQVTSAAAGMVSCSVTKEQSALFKPMSPAPFSVVITLPGGVSVCNFPYQLEVAAKINP